MVTPDEFAKYLETKPRTSKKEALAQAREDTGRTAKIERIVSGGQTGADRAGLDWAISRGIPHGGWCPKGRKSEDGSIPPRYALQETKSASYLVRTEQNVIDSDGTVIFSLESTLTGGSKRTADFAKKHRKPLIHIHPGAKDPAAALREFVAANGVKVLNIAGPRASGAPGIAQFVIESLNSAFLP